MEDEVKLDVGQLLSTGIEQVRRNLPQAAIAVLVLTVGNLILDLKAGSTAWGPAGFLSLGVQYYVTRTALNRAGLLPEGFQGRFASFWGMTIVTGVGILLGGILLVLPGLYLAARWFIAGPAILAEDRTSGEGMRISWHLMGSSAWRVVGALVVVYGAAFGFATLPAFFFPQDQVPTTVQAIGYLGAFSATVMAWLMAVGTYASRAQPQHTLAEVFA